MQPEQGEQAALVWLRGISGTAGAAAADRDSSNEAGRPGKVHPHGVDRQEHLTLIDLSLIKVKKLLTLSFHLALQRRCNSSHDALQDVDDWDLTDWEESGDEGPSPLPPLVHSVSSSSQLYFINVLITL